MDESGNTGFGDMAHQPVLTYSGILVPSDKQTHLHTQYQSICDEVLNKIKSKIHGIPKKELTEIRFFKKFELHARDFIEGESFYSKMDSVERIEVAQRLLALLKSAGILTVTSLVNKREYKQKTGDAKHYKMHELGFRELVNLLNRTLSANNQFCFVVSDNCRVDEMEMFKRILGNQPVHSSVYPDLQIQESHCSNMVQLADLVAFITAVYYRTHYGFAPRKHHNAEIVKLYEQHFPTSAHIWEYK